MNKLVKNYWLRNGMLFYFHNQLTAEQNKINSIKYYVNPLCFTHPKSLQLTSSHF